MSHAAQDFLQARLLAMVLICRNCGSVNADPGGDPRHYRCGVCGALRLERVATRGEKTFAAVVTGAAVGGLSFGPVGALVGGIVGLLLGEQRLR